MSASSHAIMGLVAVLAACGSPVPEDDPARSAGARGAVGAAFEAGAGSAGDGLQEPSGQTAFAGSAGTGAGPAAAGGAPPAGLAAWPPEVTFAWSAEQPEPPDVLELEVRNGTAGRVRLRLSWDLGPACDGHDAHLVPRVSLEPGERGVRLLRLGAGADPGGHGTGPHHLRVWAAMRYPQSTAEQVVLERDLPAAALQGPGGP